MPRQGSTKPSRPSVFSERDHLARDVAVDAFEREGPASPHIILGVEDPEPEVLESTAFVAIERGNVVVVDIITVADVAVGEERDVVTIRQAGISVLEQPQRWSLAAAGLVDEVVLTAWWGLARSETQRRTRSPLEDSTVGSANISSSGHQTQMYETSGGGAVQKVTRIALPVRL
jgi:hypothetical protein